MLSVAFVARQALIDFENFTRPLSDYPTYRTTLDSNMARLPMSLIDLEIADAAAIKHPFFDCIQSGELATAAEIAAVQVEILNLRRSTREDVSVSLGQWQSRRTVLRLILARDG